MIGFAESLPKTTVSGTARYCYDPNAASIPKSIIFAPAVPLNHGEE